MRSLDSSLPFASASNELESFLRSALTASLELTAKKTALTSEALEGLTESAHSVQKPTAYFFLVDLDGTASAGKETSSSEQKNRFRQG